VGHKQTLKENDQWDHPGRNVQSGTARHHEKRKELARIKGRTVRRLKEWRLFVTGLFKMETMLDKQCDLNPIQTTGKIMYRKIKAVDSQKYQTVQMLSDITLIYVIVTNQPIFFCHYHPIC
jgi:hypothetical protein